jgi:hypothetical protein
MGKYNNIAPYFKVPIPYIPKDDKEADPSDGKPPSVKPLLDSKGKAIDNLIIQVQPIFNGGATEQFFKWFQSQLSIRRAISRRAFLFGATRLTRNRQGALTEGT